MQTRLNYWEDEMSKTSKKIEVLFNDEISKIEAFLENYKKTNGDNFGNIVSEMDLQNQVRFFTNFVRFFGKFEAINLKKIEVIKREMEQLTKQTRDETQIILKEVKGDFMNALKHQEKLIQTNKNKISSGEATNSLTKKSRCYTSGKKKTRKSTWKQWRKS